MSLIESRYAKAMIDIALSKGAVDVFSRELSLVAEAFGYTSKVDEQQSDILQFFTNPVVEKARKKELIMSTFTEQVSEDVLNLLFLLVDKARIELITGIRSCYDNIADDIKGILKIDIYSVSPLDEETVKRLEEKYRKLYGARLARASVHIDKSLIGGLKIKIGDKLIDASIRGRIDALSNVLRGDYSEAKA